MDIKLKEYNKKYKKWKVVYVAVPPAFFDALKPGAPPDFYKIKILDKKKGNENKKGVSIMVANADLKEPTDEEIRQYPADYLHEKYDYPHLIFILDGSGAYCDMHASINRDTHVGWDEMRLVHNSIYFKNKQLKDMGFTDFMVALLYQEFLWLDMLKAMSK